MHDLFLPWPFMALRRGGPPVNPLAAFYGTGAGQIPLHLSTAGASPPGGPATGSATPLEGWLGDVIFVNGGGAAATTIAAVRAAMNDRFGLGLTL